MAEAQRFAMRLSYKTDVCFLWSEMALWALLSEAAARRKAMMTVRPSSMWAKVTAVDLLLDRVRIPVVPMGETIFSKAWVMWPGRRLAVPLVSHQHGRRPMASSAQAS